MSRIEAPSSLVRDARDLAQTLLADDWQRWRHTIGVARRAEELTATLDDEDSEVLLAAAWLHDIGYAEQAKDTGFHPLDGARHLDRLGWPRTTGANHACGRPSIGSNGGSRDMRHGCRNSKGQTGAGSERGVHRLSAGSKPLRRPAPAGSFRW
jgi:putative nucleotidyltransferase with HDIG domain